MEIIKSVKGPNMVAALGITSMLLSTTLNAASIYFEEGSQTIDMNNPAQATFTMTLNAEGLANITNGGSLHIAYDQTVIDIVSVSAIDAFWSWSDDVVSGPGFVDLNIQSFNTGFSPVTNNLITFEFAGVANGMTDITISQAEAGMPNDGLWAYYNPWTYNDASYTPYYYCVDACTAPAVANTGTIALSTMTSTITVVPVPAAVWLFMSGLLGLVAVQRRKQA